MKTNLQTKKLGEIVSITKGKNPKLFKSQTEGMLPYLGAKFMRGTKDAEFALISDKKSVPISKNDLIIICDGSKSGDMFSGFEGVLSSTMGKVEFNENIIVAGFLKAFLDLNFELFNGSKKGAAIPHLDFAVFKNLEIPLPTLKTQKEIVEKLDEKFAKLRETKKLREEAIINTEKILSQTLREIFEGGRLNGWEEKTINDIAEIKGGKRLPKNRSLSDRITNHPYLRVTDFKNGILNEQNIRFIDEDTFNDIRRYTISSDDIFISIAGTIGLVCKIPEKFNGANLTENAAKITAIDKIILKDFLYWQLLTDRIQSEFISRRIQTTISKLALFKIAEQKVFVPLLSEQQKIVKTLDELLEKIKSLLELQKSQLEDMKLLEKAYLKEAFNGEL